MILTVLIVMLLLASIVVITGQLALSARRSSADQDATLKAQYVAESGVAQAQARLNLIGSLLDSSGVVLDGDQQALKTGLQIPDGTASTTIGTLVASLCGVAYLPAPDLHASLPCPGGGTAATDGDVLSALTLTTSARLGLFTSYISPAVFSALGFPLGGALNASPQQFWTEVFSHAASGGLKWSGSLGDGAYTTNVGLRLQSIQRRATDGYVLTLSVPPVTASGTVERASRTVAVSSAATTYRLEVGRGSFAQYALFTNHHFSDAAMEQGCATDPAGCARITFTSNTVFSGPVHTNEVFNFQGTPLFSGAVASAGCQPNFTASTGADGNETCSSTTPGAYTRGTFVGAADLGASTTEIAPSICAGSTCSTPTFKDGVDWNAKYVPLPSNSSDQQGAARAGGLYLGGGVSELSLAVSTSASTPAPPSGYGKAQLVSYTQNGQSTQLATTPDHRVFVLVGGVWKPALQVAATGLWVESASVAGVAAVKANTNPLNPAVYSLFNGVIYADAPRNPDGSVQTDANGQPLSGIERLVGPARTPVSATQSTPANTPPAVADFAQLNVVSNGTIHIGSDLTYETPPCTGSASAPICTATNAANILGVYSSDGDVALDSPAVSASGMPANVRIQAILMASRGRVTVDGYDQGAADFSLGSVHLLGGIIENYYGAFGRTDGHGYGRDFVYDVRTGEGIMPPSFPTQKSWTSVLRKGTPDSSGGNYAAATLKLDGSQIQRKADGN